MIKEQWEELEDYTLQQLKKVWPESRKTNGSGGVSGNGDIKNSELVVECKYRTRKNIIIDHKQWLKVSEEAELLLRAVALVSENRSGERLITMKLEDFIEIMESKI